MVDENRQKWSMKMIDKMVDENDRQKWSTEAETERDHVCVREIEVDREIQERDGQTTKEERVRQTI
jgi:hypothetical protein